MIVLLAHRGLHACHLLPADGISGACADPRPRSVASTVCCSRNTERRTASHPAPGCTQIRAYRPSTHARTHARTYNADADPALIRRARVRGSVVIMYIIALATSTRGANPRCGGGAAPRARPQRGVAERAPVALRALRTAGDALRSLPPPLLFASPPLRG